MANKESVKNFYFTRPYKVIACILVVTVFVTMVLQSATMVAISRSDNRFEAAVNYLVDNTEYVNKDTPERVIDYLGTLGSEQTIADYYTLASMQIARGEYDKSPGEHRKMPTACITMKTTGFMWIF